MKRPLSLIGTTCCYLAVTAAATGGSLDDAAAAAPVGSSETNNGGSPRKAAFASGETPLSSLSSFEQFVVPVPPAPQYADADDETDADDSERRWPLLRSGKHTNDTTPPESRRSRQRRALLTPASAVDFDSSSSSSSRPPPSPSSPPPRTARKLYHSTTGTFRNLVLLLRFSDHASRALPDREDVSRLYNSEEREVRSDALLRSTDEELRGSGGKGKEKGKGPNDDDPNDGDDSDRVIPTGSVRQVYLQNSGGKFTIETTVVDWITLSRPESYYAAGNHGFSVFKEAIVEALEILDADPRRHGLGGDGNGDGDDGEGFSFGDFDLDEDGALDGLGVLHSGYGAEFGGTDCEGAINEERIWSHKGGLDWISSSSSSSSSNSDSSGGGVRVHRYYVSSALRGKCRSDIVRMGVICHELGHYLGLPDLYDATFEGTGLGAYDFMSQSWGWDGSGTYPPNLSAWSRVRAGWADARVLEEDGTYELEVASSSSSSSTSSSKSGGKGGGGDVVYKISAGYPDGEYLLLENRQPVGYDSKLAGGGIAIYHVDENADGQRHRGYPGQKDGGGFPHNGMHYRVALLAADGNYDMERGANQGDDGDLWHSGSVYSELSPQGGRERFSIKGGEGSKFLNTDSYQGGKVASTGIRIFGFSDAGNVMSFSVEGLGTLKDAKDEEAEKDHNGNPVVILESMFGPRSTPTPTTSHPTTSDPTRRPTPGPVTRAPSSAPTSKPVTQAPSSPPTHSPSRRPTASPTTLPLPQLIPSDNEPERPRTTCEELCLVPLPEALCPTDSRGLDDCLDVPVGALCEADGECDTVQHLNNCGIFDIYRRVDCGGGGSSVGVAAATVAAATTASFEAAPTTTAATVATTIATSGTTSFEAAATTTTTTMMTTPTISLSDSLYPGNPEEGSVPHVHHSALDGIWNSAAMAAGARPVEDTEPEPIVVASTATGDPTNSPTNWPEDDEPIAVATTIVTGGPTNSPTEMETGSPTNYPTFYPTNSLTPSPVTRDPTRSPSVKPTILVITGDDGSNQQQAEQMMRPLSSTTADSNQQGAQTRPLSRNEAGGNVSSGNDANNNCPYYPGWNLGLSHCLKDCRQPAFMDSNSLFEFDTLEGCCRLHYQGKASCRDQTLWALDRLPILEETELVSVAVSDESDIEKEDETTDPSPFVEGSISEEVEVEDREEDSNGASYSATHTKSRNWDREENYASNVARPIVEHSKPSLRGSSSSAQASAAVISIAPTDDATIHSNEGIRFVGGLGELVVGSQSHWKNDILLKFDLTPSALTQHRDYRAAGKAVLRLYALASSPTGGVVHFASSPDTSWWDEEHVTWATAPSEEHVLSTVGRTYPNSWIEVDVTGMLLADHSVVTLRIASETSNHSWVAKYSSKENEAGHPAPELRLFF